MFGLIFGASSEIMSRLAPLGPVYQAGTLSGNPVATACGLATLREIAKPGFFDSLAARTRSLAEGLADAARAAGVPLVADCEGGMFGLFFADRLPRRGIRHARLGSPLRHPRSIARSGEGVRSTRDAHGARWRQRSWTSTVAVERSVLVDPVLP